MQYRKWLLSKELEVRFFGKFFFWLDCLSTFNSKVYKPLKKEKLENHARPKNLDALRKIISQNQDLSITKGTTLSKKCPYSVFSGLYFPAFGLDTEIY